MKKTILSIITLLTLSLGVNAQDFEWAKSVGGSDNDRGNSIAIDTAGNVYTSGYFEGSVDFDPGTGIYDLYSTGGYDIFIQKVDALGNFLWAKSMGGFSQDVANAIALDADGNVYTTGYYMGTVDFNPGTGTNNLTANSDTDIFIQKLDTDGDFVWAKSMGELSSDIGYGITVDAAGNVYTTGRFEGSVDFDPGTGTDNLTSNGSFDAFIQKLDTDGDFVWAKSIGGSNSDDGSALAVDASGNVYTTGVFQETVDFNTGTGINNLTSNGNRDVFIQKLDASGNFVWAKSMGGANNESGSDIALDASGNVYIIGAFEETVDFDPGTGSDSLTSNGASDIFIQKLDTLGNFEWAKSIGGATYDLVNSLVLDGLGNIYTTGYFSGTVDFNPGTGIDNLTSNGGSDIFIQKLDATGNYEWTKSIGGPYNDRANAIAVDAAGSLYTTGSLRNTVDFNYGTETTNLTSKGEDDVFILKMSQIQTTPGTGINDQAFQNLNIYPNPTNGIINLNVSEELTSIKLLDLTGKTIKEFNAEQKQLDLSEFTTGIYFLEIANAERKSVVKIIKK